MYKNRNIAVIVPSYNEERQISKVLKSMPAFVDSVVVVDDASTDRTPSVVSALMEKDARIVLVRHERNQGVGGAIASGYKWAKDRPVDIAVVMAGDGQMDPDDLPAILDPVAEGRADFCKGNRFAAASAARIPRVRLFGNLVLSALTRAITGYRHITDTQNGYTALSGEVLRAIEWDGMYKRYGQPNDLLVKLSMRRFRVAETPTRAIYGEGEKSKMNPAKVMLPIGLLLMTLAVWKILARVRERTGKGRPSKQ